MRAQPAFRPAFIRTHPKMHHRSAFHNDSCVPLLARVINLIAFAIDCANDKTIGYQSSGRAVFHTQFPWLAFVRAMFKIKHPDALPDCI